MNPKSLLLAFACSTLLFATLNAQSTLDQQSGSGENNGRSDRKMNIIKVNILPSLLIRNFSFQYERVVSKHFSLAMGVRFMPNTGIPFKNRIESSGGITDQQAIDAINNFKMSNFALTPEMRLYLSKKGYGRGFYIAPYYRYVKYTSNDLPFTYSGGTTTGTIILKGDLKTNTGGLMFGAQWFLGKIVTLDWWILGGQFGKCKGNFTGTTTTPLSTQEQADLQSTLNDIKLPFGDLKSTVTANGASMQLSGPWAGIRGGLTLGFRF